MSVGEIAYLTGVVAAFTFFGISLSTIASHEKRHRRDQAGAADAVSASLHSIVPASASTKRAA